jgi:hypothetical protein
MAPASLAAFGRRPHLRAAVLVREAARGIRSDESALPLFVRGVDRVSCGGGGAG